jgi:hypothetical protein
LSIQPRSIVYFWQQKYLVLTFDKWKRNMNILPPPLGYLTMGKKLSMFDFCWYELLVNVFNLEDILVDSTKWHHLGTFIVEWKYPIEKECKKKIYSMLLWIRNLKKMMFAHPCPQAVSSSSK